MPDGRKSLGGPTRRMGRCASVRRCWGGANRHTGPFRARADRSDQCPGGRGAGTTPGAAFVEQPRTRNRPAHINPYRQFLALEANLAIKLRKPCVATMPSRGWHRSRSSFSSPPAVPEQDDTRETRYLQRKGLQPQTRCVTASGRVIRTMIQCRQAIGILPDYLCRDMRSDPHFRVTVLPQQREVWLLMEFGVAALSWGARTITDAKALRVIVIAFIVLHAASELLEVYAFVGGLSGAIWANVTLRALVVALFAYYGLNVTPSGHGPGER